MPDRRTRKVTFYRLSTTLLVAHEREMMVKEGAWNAKPATLRGLAQIL